MSVFVRMERLTTTHCVIDDNEDVRLYKFFKDKLGEFDDSKRYFFNYGILNELKRYIEMYEGHFGFENLKYILEEIEDELESAPKDTVYIVWWS